MRALQPALKVGRYWALGSFGRNEGEPALSRSGAIADAGTDAIGNVNNLTGSAKTYTVTNGGAGALTVYSVATSSLSGLTSATVSGNLSAATPGAPMFIAPGGTNTFVVTFDPSASSGALSCTVTVTSDAPGALASYTFTASGTAIEQEIAVLDPDGAAIADGAAYASAGGTEGVAAVHTWTVQNTGTDTLSCTVAISGESNCTATVTQALTATIAASGSDTYEVTVTPTAAGAWSYTTTITNDDANEAVHDNVASGTAAADAASYESWTEWTYTMFGAGAPDADPNAEYSSMSYIEGTGWDLTASFAAARDGYAEGIAWLRAPTVVWADAPTDYSLGLDVHVGPLPTTANKSADVLVGSSATDADSNSGGVTLIGSTKYIETNSSSARVGNATSASINHARVLHFPLPGSGRNGVGGVAVLPRGTAGVTLTVHNAHRAAGSGVESTHKIGPWFGAAAAASGAAGPTRYRGRGWLMPRAPWDGGTVGSGVGEWKRLTYDGSTPTTDTSSVYVSNAGAGDSWDVTLDATKSNDGNGWDPAAGNKRPQWTVTAPTGIVTDGSRPLLVAIKPGAAWATDDKIGIGVGLRASGVNDGPAVMLHQDGTFKGHWAGSDTARSASLSTTTTHMVGVIILDVGQSGTKYLGGAMAFAYLADGPNSATGGVSDVGDAAATFTGSAELFVFVTNLATLGTANRRCQAEIWLCNPDIDLTAGP